MGLLQSIARVSSRFAPRNSTSSARNSGDPRHHLGRRGETEAARFLRRNGYKILYRNFRAPGGGEIDLVCRDGNTLVFVEVKTRTTLRHGTPLEAVNAKKRALITRGAMAWLRMLGFPDILIRFDVVGVLQAHRRLEPELVRDVFTLPPNYRV